MSERTLAMIKPDATGGGNTGNILAHLEDKGFDIVAMKMLRVNRGTACAFYDEHRNKPFFSDLVDFITSGRVVAVALERDNAVKYLREVIGATDPAEAADGTVRNLYASTKTHNAIHASDSPASAERELAFFFSRMELLFEPECPDSRHRPE